MPVQRLQLLLRYLSSTATLGQDVFSDPPDL